MVPFAKGRNVPVRQDTERRQWNQTLPQEGPCRAPAKQTGDERRNEYLLSQRRRSTQSAPSEEAAFRGLSVILFGSGPTPPQIKNSNQKKLRGTRGPGKNRADFPTTPMWSGDDGLLSYGNPFRDETEHAEGWKDGYVPPNAVAVVLSTKAIFRFRPPWTCEWIARQTSRTSCSRPQLCSADASSCSASKV
jgi:hypothetical protein